MPSPKLRNARHLLRWSDLGHLSVFRPYLLAPAAPLDKSTKVSLFVELMPHKIWLPAKFTHGVGEGESRS